jgi:hypothetical protein
LILRKYLMLHDVWVARVPRTGATHGSIQDGAADAAQGFFERAIPGSDPV